MSGHSKWHNIKRKKEVVDSQKGKIFTRHAKLISIAAKNGGDPAMNPNLKAAILNAKADNVPNANIEKAIKKGLGEDKNSAVITETLYGGFGPKGVAILVLSITDNKNRAYSNIRNIFTKNGGNIAETNAISWLFNRKGQIIAKSPIEKTTDEIEIMIIDSGAEDFYKNNDEYEIITSDTSLMEVRENLSKNGFNIVKAELSYIPKNTVKIDDKESAKQILKIMDALEEDEDVADLYSNFEIPEEIIASL